MGKANNPCKITYENEPYMKEPCICERQVVKWGPCVISEYNAKFRAHSACPRRPIMPTTVALHSDGSMSDRTTNREDYVPKTIERRQGRPKETYKPPSTAFDHDTNYRLTYTPKQVCPPEPYHPPPILRCPARFDGNPTYKNDYRPWSVPPPERRKVSAYKPSDAPFNGLSTSRADYVPKGNCKRPSLKPSQKLTQSDQPLDSATNYRTDFVQHPLEPRECSKKEYQVKTLAPFDGLTTNRTDYTPKDICIPRSLKPTDTLIRSNEPLSGDTTNRVDYIPHKLQPQQKHRPYDEYRVPDVPMEKGTTYKLDYPVLPICRPEPVTHPEYPKCPTPFDGKTMYNTDYKTWDVRRQIVKPIRTYTPPNVPMETLSTNMADYVPKQACRAASVKPAAKLLTSGDFDSKTNYMTEYTPKKFDWHCPAAFLNKEKISRDGYAFEATDPCGHEHYKMVGNPTEA
ncbi:unnamed protein product [Hymenolepis diminuta]|uniref:Stabilizer of axonemal microtubules 2 n=1 Tax=Hymenolepis diminuta TaxID=6216 RepID=A0A158QBT6_HYMDI|nr:unnamed protein product [Hymenolepis diminuta]